MRKVVQVNSFGMKVDGGMGRVSLSAYLDFGMLGMMAMEKMMIWR
jgi:hypothetical protein